MISDWHVVQDKTQRAPQDTISEGTASTGEEPTENLDKANGSRENVKSDNERYEAAREKIYNIVLSRIKRDWETHSRKEWPLSNLFSNSAGSEKSEDAKIPANSMCKPCELQCQAWTRNNRSGCDSECYGKCFQSKGHGGTHLCPEHEEKDVPRSTKIKEERKTNKRHLKTGRPKPRKEARKGKRHTTHCEAQRSTQPCSTCNAVTIARENKAERKKADIQEGNESLTPGKKSIGNAEHEDDSPASDESCSGKNEIAQRKPREVVIRMQIKNNNISDAPTENVEEAKCSADNVGMGNARRGQAHSEP